VVRLRTRILQYPLERSRLAAMPCERAHRSGAYGCSLIWMLRKSTCPVWRLQANELEICRRLPAVDVGVHEIRLLLAV